MTDNAPTSAVPTKTAILVAAFDSQLKWAATIQEVLSREGLAAGDRAK